MKNRYFKFSNTEIEIQMPETMKYPDNMKKFKVDKVNSKYYYKIEFTEDLKKIMDDFIEQHTSVKTIQRKNMLILLSKDIELRVIWIVGTNQPYAITIEQNMCETKIWIDPWIKPLLQSDTVFGSLLALEKKVLEEGALILHSAYICRKNKAVLFTAPSGTGKSTQADLWKKYRKTRTINGDRTLIVRKVDGWYAYGWPICGSSEICYNESYPIQAIVVLKQAKVNKVRRMNRGESVKKILSEVTVNTWNSDFQRKTFNLLDDLTQDVGIYELECNISEEAVNCLELKI